LELVTRRSVAPARKRILIVGASLGLHIAILTGLVLDRPHPLPPPADFAIEVQLLPIARLKRPVRPAHREAEEKLVSVDARRPEPAALPSLRPHVIQAPPSPTAPALPQGLPDVDPRLVSALRSIVGCGSATFLHLSAAERDACEQAARRRGASALAANPGVDLSKRLEFDAAAKRNLLQQPFLALHPKNGCVPRVTSLNDLPGKGPQETTAGVACALSF
jgi:hypothetical protein